MYRTCRVKEGYGAVTGKSKRNVARHFTPNAEGDAGFECLCPSKGPSE
jgi:hypothetical protein